MWKTKCPSAPSDRRPLGQWRDRCPSLCRAGPMAPGHTNTRHPSPSPFSHISASVAPTLGHSAPYISFHLQDVLCPELGRLVS